MRPKEDVHLHLKYVVYTCFLAAALLLSGCASPVGVSSLDNQETNRKLTENVLSDQSLSAPTQQILNRSGLVDKFRLEPADAIEALRTGIPTASRSDRFFALAELSFLHADKGGDQSYYLAAAVYAYAFLFPKESSAIPNPFDPRLVTAVNLYNQGIALGLYNKESGTIEIKTDIYKLPFGELSVHLDPDELKWGRFNMVDFVSAAKLDVRGLKNDYRWPGIGSAMVAALKPIQGKDEQKSSLVPPALKVTVTALLRLENIEENLKKDRLAGELKLFTTQEETSIDINGRTVPLAFRPSTALASTLEGSLVYDLELKRLLSGDISFFKEAARFKDNVFLMAPYRPGRIPLVLVHGTASSPARWAEIINEVFNDPELLHRYQIWLFTYNTGNPILYSGGLLTQGLKNIVKELDPEGKDEVLRKMVVIGHSQGGMLTKLTAIDSGNLFYDRLFSVPIEKLDVSPKTRELLYSSLFYKPLPFVRQVVFISTPHRGSYLSSNWVGNLMQRMISLPLNVLNPLQEVFQKEDILKIKGMKNSIPRSTDNMNPDSEFVKTFASIPLSPTIRAHSIIAVENPKDPKEKWVDGVVAYKSAHIDGVESELVVHSGHSAQDNQDAIEEVRRILIDNLKEK